MLELGFGGVILGRPPETVGAGFAGEATPRGVDLPVITGLPTDRLEPGAVIRHPGVRRALAFLALLEAYGFSGGEWVSEIRVDEPDSLVVYLLHGGTPVRIGDGRLSRRRIRALFATLENLRERGVNAEYIDLRFVNQVVVKEG